MSNLKNSSVEMKDKILLRKRSVIETVNDQLKNIAQAEHSRHRSFGFYQDLLNKKGYSAIILITFPKKFQYHMPERVGLYAIPRTELIKRKTGFKKGVGSVSEVLSLKF